MKKFSIILTLLLLGCTTIRDDVKTPMSDTQARFYSVLTEVDGQRSYGPAVYVIQKDSSLENRSLKFHTIFNGSYTIDSDFCSLHKEGRYNDGEVVSINLADFLDTKEEKLCTVVISVKPDKPEDFKVALSPRFTVVKFQVSSRENNPVIVSRHKQNNALPLFRFITDDSSGEYRIRGKCSYDNLSFVKEGLNYSGGIIELNEEELRGTATANGQTVTVGFNKGATGDCFYSILYSKDAQGKFKNRAILYFNTYHEVFVPLSLSVETSGNDVDVSGPKEVYFCGVNKKIKKKSKCSGNLKDLPDSFIIEGHTNKRSFYLNYRR